MKSVIVTPNPYRDRNFETVRSAAEILKQAGIEVKICLPFEVDHHYTLPKDIRFHRLEKELPNADAIICLGGDGTILHMAKSAVKYGLPILGINTGTLGFMAELETSELRELSKLATDDYRLDSRMMLDISVYRERDIIYHDWALNDIAITKGTVARIIGLSVKCDETKILECSGDGLVISTPTGSTAYNLSAGGPIVEPEVGGILITPICAHDCVNRSILVSDKRQITAELNQYAHRNAYLSVDGGKAVRINPQDLICVHKSDRITNLMRLKNRSFFEVLNSKI